MKRADTKRGEGHVAVGVDGRCCLPGSIRSKYKLGESCKEVEVTIDRRDVLLVFFSVDELMAYVARMAADTPGMKESDVRFFFLSKRRTVTVETRGRILLPQPLRSMAGIVDRAEVVDGEGYLYVLAGDRYESE